MGYKQCIKCGKFCEDSTMFCSSCGNRFFENQSTGNPPQSPQSTNEQSAFKYTQNTQSKQSAAQIGEPSVSYTDQGFQNSQPTEQNLSQQPQNFAGYQNDFNVQNAQGYYTNPPQNAQNPQYTQGYQAPQQQQFVQNYSEQYPQQQAQYMGQYQNPGFEPQYAQNNSPYAPNTFYPQSPNMYSQPTNSSIKGFVKAFSIIGFILGIQTLIYALQTFIRMVGPIQLTEYTCIIALMTAISAGVFSVISLIKNKSDAHKKYKTFSILGLVFSGIGILVTILALITNFFNYFY